VECFVSLLLMIGLASRLTAIPVAVTMAVAYLTADLEAVTSIFSDPDKFVKADPFPYFICALIVLVFGPGRFSIDALRHRERAKYAWLIPLFAIEWVWNWLAYWLNGWGSLRYLST
jgi:uncharacterized membrane protein YphA (DoxX/SURF4 family)